MYNSNSIKAALDNFPDFKYETAGNILAWLKTYRDELNATMSTAGINGSAQDDLLWASAQVTYFVDDEFETMKKRLLELFPANKELKQALRDVEDSANDVFGSYENVTDSSDYYDKAVGGMPEPPSFDGYYKAEAEYYSSIMNLTGEALNDKMEEVIKEMETSLMLPLTNTGDAVSKFSALIKALEKVVKNG